jgi:hypothetical protein
LLPELQAQTLAHPSRSSSLVDEIATKFQLSKTDVQQVVDRNKSDNQAHHAAIQKAKLDKAVKHGKLTQAQEDYIVNTQADIKNLIGTTKPRNLSQTTKNAIKAKMDTLRSWAQTNNINMRYVGGPGRGIRMHSYEPNNKAGSNTATTTN